MLEAALRAHRGAFALEAAFEVAHGETLVLVGESGAGKSSVLRLLAGLTTPTSGRVVMAGEAWCDTARGVSRPVWRRDIGFVAQGGALFPHLDVRAQVEFGPRAAGWSAARIAARTEVLLASFGLTELASRRPAQLSGGQCQRVALARALALEPALLLLDEPFAALDVASRRELRTVLRRELAMRAGATVLVTHDPMEALLLGDRIAVLEQGRIVSHGLPDDLMKQPHIREAYLGV